MAASHATVTLGIQGMESHVQILMNVPPKVTTAMPMPPVLTTKDILFAIAMMDTLGTVSLAMISTNARPVI